MKMITFVNLESMKTFKTTTVFECAVLKLPIVHSQAGNVSTLSNSRHIMSFDIKRLNYLYDVPGGEARSGHAHKKLNQMIIAAFAESGLTKMYPGAIGCIVYFQ